LNKESWAVDYGGGMNMLNSLRLLSEKCETDNGPSGSGLKKPQFVLLSAFCCGKPLLQFQYAKLKLEENIKKLSVQGDR
jgi:hypothetical protein